MVVYIAVNTVNGKVYIGKHQRNCPVTQRWKEHQQAAARGAPNSYFLNAIRKYGFEAFSFSVLLDGITDRKELSFQERKFITQYQSSNPAIGYNLTAGGEGGGAFGNKNGLGKRPASRGIRLKEYWAGVSLDERRKRAQHRASFFTKELREQHPPTHTEESKKKISVALKGRPHPWSVGRTVSLETREKLSKALKGKNKKGRPWSQEQTEKMSAIMKGRKVPWLSGSIRSKEAREKTSRALKLRAAMKRVDGQALLLQHCCGSYL